jgi:hypothetical protein
MSNFKVVNVKNSEVAILETKKEVAEMISASNVTENSLKTIEKKVGKAMKNEETLFDTFKIEETEEEVVMNNEVKNEEVTVEDVNEVAVEETVEETPEVEPAETVEEIDEDAPEQSDEDAEADYLESPEAEQQVEDENKAAEKLIGGEKKDEDKPNKRRVGKTLIAYKNGEEYEKFPSIKACATHFKDLLGLPHMPFTPIMKSVRQDVDWNEYSFQFENEEDLHIPESLKKKIEESKSENEKPSEDEKAEMKDQAKETESEDEVIEEITEEELA